MKTKLLRGLLVILLGYLLLVAVHFIYLEMGGSPEDLLSRRWGNDEARKVYALELPALTSAASAVRNYASVSFKTNAGATVGDQKYEKIGTLTATTAHFDDDDKKTRAVVRDVQGLIQEEALNSSGGFRTLRLTIGVPPGAFDAAIVALRKIGQPEDFTITKNDKTNEYLQLRAKRTTLEKTRDALIALKTQGGKIEELVKLEHEILDLEGKIQELGVQLGQFDQVNEFCTVHFNLSERLLVSNNHPHFARLLASLAWASGVYLSLLAAGVVGLLCLVLALVVTQKAKVILAAAEKP